MKGKSMVDIKRDTKAKVEMWIITLTDSEGYHKQLNISDADMSELIRKYRVLKSIENAFD